MQPGSWMNADLHCHSCVSDGTLTLRRWRSGPKRGASSGLTDHESVAR